MLLEHRGLKIWEQSKMGFNTVDEVETQDQSHVKHGQKREHEDQNHPVSEFDQNFHVITGGGNMGDW